MTTQRTPEPLMEIPIEALPYVATFLRLEAATLEEVVKGRSALVRAAGADTANLFRRMADDVDVIHQVRRAVDQAKQEEGRDDPHG